MERMITVTKVGKDEKFTKADILNLLGMPPDEANRIRGWWVAQDEAEAYHRGNDADYYLFAKRV